MRKARVDFWVAVENDKSICTCAFDSITPARNSTIATSVFMQRPQNKLANWQRQLCARWKGFWHKYNETQRALHNEHTCVFFHSVWRIERVGLFFHWRAGAANYAFPVLLAFCFLTSRARWKATPLPGGGRKNAHAGAESAKNWFISGVRMCDRKLFCCEETRVSVCAMVGMCNRRARGTHTRRQIPATKVWEIFRRSAVWLLEFGQLFSSINFSGLRKT